MLNVKYIPDFEDLAWKRDYKLSQFLKFDYMLKFVNISGLKKY